jgi:hypothetical protein
MTESSLHNLQLEYDTEFWEQQAREFDTWLLCTGLLKLDNNMLLTTYEWLKRFLLWICDWHACFNHKQMRWIIYTDK